MTTCPLSETVTVDMAMACSLTWQEAQSSDLAALR
jgi:hypothetical protein